MIESIFLEAEEVNNTPNNDEEIVDDSEEDIEDDFEEDLEEDIEEEEEDIKNDKKRYHICYLNSKGPPFATDFFYGVW